MSSDDILASELPFHREVDYNIEIFCSTSRTRIQNMMEDHGLVNYLHNTRFHDLFDPSNKLNCDYYDEDNFNKLNRSSSEFLSIISLNISSLPKHGGELLCFLSNLNIEFDIIVLTEIGARNISTVETLFVNYEFHYILPHNNMRGGVGVYFAKSISNLQIVDRMELTKSCRCMECATESIFFEFDFYKITCVLGAIYRHPKGNKMHFVSDLETTLDLIPDDKLSIICGDINIDLANFENKEVMNYLSALLSHRYLPYISLPSRITSHSATCIDHIFVRSIAKESLHDILAGLFYCDISDHLPCFLSLKFSRSNDAGLRRKIRIFSERNCANFSLKMRNFNWELIYQPNCDWYSIFVKNVQDIFHSSFPLVRISRKRNKDKPWITKELKTSIKENHRLFRISVEKQNENSTTRYKRYKNQLRIRTKQAEINYYQQLFENHKNSSFNLWKGLGCVINPKRNKSSSISKLLYEGQMVTDVSKIPDVMNEHFCHIGENLQKHFPKERREFTKYLKHRVINSFYLSDVNVEDVLNELKRLNPKKSSGPDNISVKIILLCPEVFATNLTKIFNNSIQLGEYPTAMKVAKVIALYKKGEKFKPGNYRPISLLSIFNKIFEKLICKKLLVFLDLNKVLYEFQFGFRTLHSTTLALIDLVDNLRQQLDEGNYVLGIFIDLTKAFDTVDHDILLHKLEFYGIRGHTNNFFKSYLTNRLQYTVANGHESGLKPVTCGVPQGSVLGPLFFLIYINDLHHAVDNVLLRLFADDTGSFNYSKDIASLLKIAKDNFIKLYEWCKANKLTINTDKTCFLIFHARNKPVPADLKTLAIEELGIVLNRVPSVQYLGVYIDETLNWHDHVNHVCQSLVKYFGIFNQIKHFVSKKLARQLYFAFIYSRIKYGIEVYGTCASSILNKIQIMQNRLLKLLLRIHYRTPTDALHGNIQVLKVKDIFTTNILAFVNDCLTGNCPDLFKNYFPVQRATYALRSQGSLVVKRTRLSLAAQGCYVLGAVLWNKLDVSLFDRKYTKSFKKSVVKFTLNKYNS